MISRSGYLCFLSHWLFLTCFPLIWADWASHVPSRRWYWTGRNRGWLKICSLQFLQQLWTILFQIKSGCWQANWQMQSHSPSARTHQQYMCHLWSICRKDDMPIALGQLGRMQQHRKVCPWAFLLLLLPTWERFGNLVRQCFKTALATDISKHLLWATGLLSKIGLQQEGLKCFFFFFFWKRIVSSLLNSFSRQKGRVVLYDITVCFSMRETAQRSDADQSYSSRPSPWFSR